MCDFGWKGMKFKMKKIFNCLTLKKKILFLFLTILFGISVSFLLSNDSLTITDNFQYLLDNVPSDGQIIYEGGENSSAWQNDGVSVSKTIEGTNKEDYFDITLKVKSKVPVTDTLLSEDTAVVLVIDLSNTMAADMNGNASNVSYNSSKAGLASSAVENFVQQFYDGSNDYTTDVIGAVGFNTNGVSLVPMTELSSQSSVNQFNSSLHNNIKNVITGYSASDPERYTNIEAGLKMAKSMLSNCSQKYKYVVFVSDGLPTTYTKTTSATDYTGVTVTTLKDGLNNNRLLQYGGNYSDTGAVRARKVAMELKNNGVTIYSVGIGLSTFSGTSNSSVPFGSKEGLNGEQMIMNQLGRSVALNSPISTVENSFGNVTSGNKGASAWATYKEQIYNLDWEIKNNFNPETMGNTPKYVLSETPPVGQPKLFENWLKYGIGSGYYYDVTSGGGLTDAINKIYEDSEDRILGKKAAIWSTNDPMASYDVSTNSLLDYIEFQGFFASDGSLASALNGNYGQNNTNTASLVTSSNDVSGTINWDLKKSGYSVVNEANENIYVYKLKYRVRLKTDKQGFKDEFLYNTNGVTTLNYLVDSNGTINQKSLNYPIPQVEGYLVDLKVKNVVEGLAPGMSFTEQNSNFEFTVSFKNSDNLTVDNTFTYDKYDASDNVILANQSISSGDTFILRDGEYVVIHNLFHGINYSITETSKDGFVSTVSSGNASGTMVSSVSLTEVDYVNKAYHAKIKKVDSESLKPLSGVSFTLYLSHRNGNFSDVVTNMNGVVLENLLTDDNGIIDFGNLSFINGEKTIYYLVENSTIDKYNYLDNYVEIIVDENGISAQYNGSDLQVNKNENVFEIVVPNVKEIVFPLTGGSGALFFTVLGLLLMGIALFGFTKNKNN